MTTPRIETRPFIHGEHVDPAQPSAYAITNPATEETITEIALAGRDDVDRAVDAAHAALRGPWASFDGRKRQQCLLRLADLIDKNVDEIALLETLDTGKTLFDSGKVEVPLAAEVYRYFAGFATKLHGQTTSSPTNLRYTVKGPVGVCGLIIPWNFPFMMASWKLAPALAAGNTVVLKPAEDTPLTALYLGKLLNEAGFPPGVVNIVPGLGSVAGARLVEHPRVAKIAFTGSTDVGRTIASTAAATLKRVSLELGGKSANIVFADADMKAAVRGALGGIFYNKGEVCAAGSRLFVERAAHDGVVLALKDAVAKMTLGDPRQTTTRMGPVASKAQLDKVLRYIELGKSSGATLVAGGARASDVNAGKGYFVQPTIFSDVAPESAIAREEIFGPVLCVIPFDDVENAIRKANDSRYGLAAGVWTKDIKKALKTAHALEAGTVWVNTYNLYDPSLPFGGVKESGYGKDLGEAALAQYLDEKSVWVDLS
jgi:acyl-CoA reductase-like NAD-dependent aldehyde dehydrogenase